MLNRFAHPLLLAFLALLPALGVLALWARRRRRHDLARLGDAALLRAAGAGPRRGGRLLAGLGLLLGLVGLGVGMAGPQWGRDWSQSAAPGRDLVVALDCSRSMFAEAPSRWERGRAALLDLAQALERRGGHRVALVVFAGRARLVCPLTHDYDSFREAVANLDPAALAAELAPGPGEPSGTRIGLGLHQAVLAHDERFPGARDILLLSDGDDPARDGEWQLGAAEAQAQGIPVYAVGLGDPDVASPVPGAGGPLRFDGREVRSRLEEAPLREVARRTQGLYFPAHTRPVALGAVYLETVAAQPVRESADDALPVYQGRSALFLAPAFGLLAAWVALGGRPGRAARRLP
jgi:Ca-activated chloride channel family protein